MARCAVALVGTAILLAAVDLAYKVAAGGGNVHPRSALYVVVVIALLTAWVGTILAARSMSLAIGGGVLAGGALGNVLSLAVWPGVPNPLVLDLLAFNLADVFVLAGFALVGAITLDLVARSPERLGEPIRVRERASADEQI
jgi:lipoprotein signal peptidase